MGLDSISSQYNSYCKGENFAKIKEITTMMDSQGGLLPQPKIKILELEKNFYRLHKFNLSDDSLFSAGMHSLK